MKILVTGANGYLGKGVVRYLLDNGYDVIATDIKDTFIDKRAKIKCVDIFTVENPYEYFLEPDIVLHMAWRNGFIHDSITHIEDLNLHYKFLTNLIKKGISQIVVLGSMHEIGFYEGSINEHTPANPQSLYGIAKDSLRKLIELECSNTDITFQWLRGFYIVGNTEDGYSIFSKIIQCEKKGEIKFPFTRGINQFDFLDYNTFCKYVTLVVNQRDITGIINICSGRPEKLADRVERFIKENNFKIKLDYGAFPDRPYDSKAVWGDDYKLNKILKVK